MDEGQRALEMQRAASRPRTTGYARPNAVAQVALYMAQAIPGRPYRDMRFSIGKAEDGLFHPALTFGVEGPDVTEGVGRGEMDLGTINPSAFLTMAYLGTGPYAEALPVRVIGVMPSFDVMGFALSERTGCRTLAEVHEKKYPLHVSIRDNPSHAPLYVIDEVLRAEGFSLADIESWGGSVQWVEVTPQHPLRTAGMQFGKIDAVFDEGINSWGPIALQTGFRFARLQDSTLAHMEQIGWATCPISERFARIRKEDDVQTISFSGWAVFTHSAVSDEVAYQMADALWQRREYIVWDLDRPIELTDLAGGFNLATPRGVPLHPGAERYYREKGVTLSPVNGERTAGGSPC